ncbi:Outer membrane protein IcsA autotransporter precursor [Edwardsiella tarda]|nr:Outer membrane protein IcsA autotransporter precursor [Edwardsiella tarda]
MKAKILTPLLTLSICWNATAASGLFGDYIFVNNGSKGTLSMSKINSSGVSVESGGELTLGNGRDGSTLNVLVNKESSVGVLVSGKDSYLSVQNKNATIKSELKGVTGVEVSAQSNVNLNNFDITLSGADSIGVIAKEKSSITFNDTNIYSSGSALSALNGGVIRVNSTSNKLSSNNSPVINSIGSGSAIYLDGNLQVNGDLLAKDNGEISAEFKNGSELNGAVNGIGGDVNLTFDNGVWNVTGTSSLQNLNINNSLVSFSNPSIGTKNISINGDFKLVNSVIKMNVFLGGDESPSDKMVISGDSSGKAYIYINNIGGSGEKTKNGIKLIQVNGKSNGEFVQANRVVAGLYDYNLQRGNGGLSNDWYLISDLVLRPEIGSYIANLASANTLFQLRLQDRNGSAAYMLGKGTDQQRKKNMWIRHVGGKTKWHDNNNQLKTKGERYTLQLGGDVGRWSFGEGGALHLGMMAGYANASSHTRSSRTGYRSEGNVNGYSSGLYATWYANDVSREGAYLDSWTQYSWFNNTVSGQDLSSESYRSDGVTASVEVGITHQINSLDDKQSSNSQWFIQPQAQVVMMDVHADSHQERNGTLIMSDKSTNIQTRVGVKTWLNKKYKLKSGQVSELLPFAEVNWLHTRHDFSSQQDGVVVYQDGIRDIGELKVGIEGQVNNRMNAWVNVSLQGGSNGYRDTAAMLGVQWRF